MRSCDDHFTQSNLLTEDIMVLDTYTYCFREFWYHVNGFCFDPAGVLCRGLDGAPLSAPPIAKAIAKDPVLSKCKIIAEPWDCGGLYLVGKFPSCDNGGTVSGFFFKGERMISKHLMRSTQQKNQAYMIINWIFFNQFYSSLMLMQSMNVLLMTLIQILGLRFPPNVV